MSSVQVWKARVNGYEEAGKLFGQWDEDDPKWKNYAPLAKKMVNDRSCSWSSCVPSFSCSLIPLPHVSPPSPAS